MTKAMPSRLVLAGAETQNGGTFVGDLLFGGQYGFLKREQQHFLSLLYPTTDLVT